MDNVMDLDEGGAEVGHTVSDTAKRMASAKAQASKVNGAKGGAPLGTKAPHSDKRTYDPERLANNLAERIITGQGLPVSPYANAAAPNEDDRKHVARITGIPVEEFQAKISARLQEIAEKAGMRIVEKLDEGGQKLSDLNMTLAISIDKIAAISGRTAQSGNVSVTVNNYGAMSRAEMLAQLEAERKGREIQV